MYFFVIYSTRCRRVYFLTPINFSFELKYASSHTQLSCIPKLQFIYHDFCASVHFIPNFFRLNLLNIRSKIKFMILTFCQCAVSSRVSAFFLSIGVSLFQFTRREWKDFWNFSKIFFISLHRSDQHVRHLDDICSARF